MHQKWILLVEDDPDHVALALRALRKSNVPAEIVVANSGADALQMLMDPLPGAREPLPRLVLLDLKLPTLDGFAVLRRLRSEQRTATLPVVVLTSSDEERDKIESYDLGANSYIQKPVDYDRFLEVIREIGRYWLTVNHSLVGG
ncbi:MAG TPA: response regulator [Symbiobacteriaceae bacterium]|nr:response regulator [Symbiobacteriaceae bacterium]